MSDIDYLTLQMVIHYGKLAREYLAPLKPTFDLGFYLSAGLLAILTIAQGLILVKNFILALLFNVRYSFANYPGMSAFFGLLFLTVMFGALRILV